ncbi:MAG TPA: hypothetical protein VMJ93_10270 [Verrucomicrobiae bacterium]|nr:hypothetical protein [Verrucomicrobiae bacterium]
MGESAADILRNAGKTFQDWLGTAKRNSDTKGIRSEDIKAISSALQRAEKALRKAPREEKDSPELSAEIASYRKILQELQTTLEHVGIRLQIRRAQMTGAKSHLQAVKRWAELTQKLR